MNIHLLVIDPQNDFMDVEGAALPVAGAVHDMERLAGLIGGLTPSITDITITLDSHHSIGIERPGFWRRGGGGAIQPFTQITAAQVRAGEFTPADCDALPRVLAYLDALEAAGRYKLMVWPVHCEIGTWGHNVYRPVRDAYAQWEAARLRTVRKVFKGMNPATEMYSALQAEVPIEDDEQTQLNRPLIALLDRADVIFIAGEASSHCVRATTEHLASNLPRADASKLVILSDCMSPVSGFEEQARKFLADMQARGARSMTAQQAQAWCSGLQQA